MTPAPHTPLSQCLGLLARQLAPGCLAVEAADFCAALAGLLADLVKARRLGPGSRLWLYAVDCLLVKAVDAHTQVGVVQSLSDGFALGYRTGIPVMDCHLGGGDGRARAGGVVQDRSNVRSAR